MKKIKKVLFVCSVYKPNVGGIETAIEELSQYYSSKGIKSTVLTKKFPFDLPEIEKIDGIEILRFKRPIIDDEYKKLLFWLKKNEDHIKSDIVHVIGVRRPMPLIGLLLARRWEVPFIINFSGGDVPDQNDAESLRIWKEENGTVVEPIKQADKLISFSKGINRLVKKSIPKLKQIDVIYAGIDLGRIKKAKTKELPFDYIITARRLLFDKGVDLLVDAFSLAKSKINGVKLLIVGDRPERLNLEKQVKDFGLEEDVIFKGTVELDELFSYLKGAVAHVCPSRAEGGGTINFEAQATGCLAIGSSAGGIPEYIRDGVTGLIFKSGDKNDLSKKIIISVNNRKLRDRLTEQAMIEVEKYSWENIGEQYLKVYLSTRPDNKINPWSKLSRNLWSNFNSK